MPFPTMAGVENLQSTGEIAIHITTTETFYLD